MLNRLSAWHSLGQGKNRTVINQFVLLITDTFISCSYKAGLKTLPWNWGSALAGKAKYPLAIPPAKTIGMEMDLGMEEVIGVTVDL